MYFDFSPEQYLARDSAREFLAARMAPARLRQLLDDDSGFDRDVWRGLAELGWMSVLLPEKHGGLGLGFLDLALLLEESGRALLPAPIVETAVMVPLALRRASAGQRERWLPRIASGEVVATVALGDREGSPPLGLGVSAREDGDAFVLDGEVLLVPFGEAADVVLTAAHGGRGVPDGTSLFLIERDLPGLSWQPLASLDPTIRLATMRLQSLRVSAESMIGAPGQGWAALEPAIHAARAALALQAVGGAGRALEMAAEYAKVRHQFGRPIGSFQAVKHKCADMLVGHETTRSGAYYAAWAVDTEAPDAAAAAAMAKALCTEMFCSVAAEAIQVHGGIGFTWEHDLHFYFKRAKYLEFALGTPTDCREAVAAGRFGT